MAIIVSLYSKLHFYNIYILSHISTKGGGGGDLLTQVHVCFLDLLNIHVNTIMAI